MARKIKEEEVYADVPDFNLALDEKEVEYEIPKKETQETPTVRRAVKVSSNNNLVNCLRKERIIVRHIDKQTGMITDPKHVLYGGMAETAKKTFTVPLLRSGAFTDILTKAEKDYLEYALGLEPNALSVYIKGNNNFWSNSNPQGISKVTLYKHDNYFDLSDPVDYIKVKILLANKDYIAPSIEALQDTPKASYEFVLISETDKSKVATARVNNKKLAYKLLGKVEDDIDTLRFIIETIDGRPTAKSAKLDVLQIKADDLIQSNASMFIKVVNDPSLSTKVLIKKAIEAGIISKRGDFHYIRKDNTPMCEAGQDPTLSMAADYLNSPKHQEMKFSIEAQLNS